MLPSLWVGQLLLKASESVCLCLSVSLSLCLQVSICLSFSVSHPVSLSVFHSVSHSVSRCLQLRLRPRPPLRGCVASGVSSQGITGSFVWRCVVGVPSFTCSCVLEDSQLWLHNLWQRDCAEGGIHRTHLLSGNHQPRETDRPVHDLP